MIHDCHCHFFSRTFFAALGSQINPPSSVDETLERLGWHDPGSSEALAARWVTELDRCGVGKAALMASLPGDEDSVARAVAVHPDRFVGFFMFNPTQPGAADRLKRALGELGLSVPCLFPALHGYRLDSPEVRTTFELTASLGRAVFVHCGILKIGVRDRLGLPTISDIRLGNPLDLHWSARTHPDLPVVIPHFGAGFFREALMLADLHKGVCFDSSSSNAWIRYVPGLDLQGVFRTAFEVAGPSRVLFGTDSSFFPRGWQTGVFQEQTAVLEALGVSEEDKAAFLSTNFERLFSASTS